MSNPTILNVLPCTQQGQAMYLKTKLREELPIVILLLTQVPKIKMPVVLESHQSISKGAKIITLFDLGYSEEDCNKLLESIDKQALSSTEVVRTLDVLRMHCRDHLSLVVDAILVSRRIPFFKEFLNGAQAYAFPMIVMEGENTYSLSCGWIKGELPVTDEVSTTGINPRANFYPSKTAFNEHWTNDLCNELRTGKHWDSRYLLLSNRNNGLIHVELLNAVGVDVITAFKSEFYLETVVNRDKYDVRDELTLLIKEHNFLFVILDQDTPYLDVYTEILSELNVYILTRTGDDEYTVSIGCMSASIDVFIEITQPWKSVMLNRLRSQMHSKDGRDIKYVVFSHPDTVIHHKANLLVSDITPLNELFLEENNKRTMAAGLVQSVVDAGKTFMQIKKLRPFDVIIMDEGTPDLEFFIEAIDTTEIPYLLCTNGKYKLCVGGETIIDYTSNPAGHIRPSGIARGSLWSMSTFRRKPMPSMGQPEYTNRMIGLSNEPHVFAVNDVVAVGLVGVPDMVIVDIDSQARPTTAKCLYFTTNVGYAMIDVPLITLTLVR